MRQLIFGPNKWFCEATNMRIDASRWGCAKKKCHARPTANKFSRLWNICKGNFNLHFVWWRSKDSALCWKFIAGKFITLPVLTEQHIRCFLTTENNVGKYKSKSISLELYCSCRQPWFSKDGTIGTIGTNKRPNATRVGDGFIECANVSLERSLRMKVLNGIAWVVHLT